MNVHTSLHFEQLNVEALYPVFQIAPLAFEPPGRGCIATVVGGARRDHELIVGRYLAQETCVGDVKLFPVQTNRD